MKARKDLLMYSINNDYVEHEFYEGELLRILECLTIIKNNEEIISIDEYHTYKNQMNKKYAYDSDGGIYEIDIEKNVAKLIDSLLIIKKSN